MIVDTLISKYLTSEQAAEQLGVCVPQLYRMCRDKRIGHRKHGKKFIFTLADLETYLDSIAVAPADPKPGAEQSVKLKHIKAS